MAAVFTNATAAGVGITEVTIYTAAAKAILVGCNAANTVDTTLPFTLSLKRGASITHIAKSKRVAAGDSYEVMKGNKIVILPGDSIVATAGEDASFDVILSLLEGVA